MSSVQFSIYKNCSPNPCSKGEHNKVIFLSSTTIPLFSKRCTIHIIVNRYWNF
ncbi:hypothetical protein BMB171_C0384 [Bacillus thuringiensis BMB171]|nr:hypothetical protein BMB171_C0384 [Bacillus thuringiensis BMB171]